MKQRSLSGKLGRNDDGESSPIKGFWQEIAPQVRSSSVIPLLIPEGL
jgi:hypothetical protein